jgi:HlyD family secretion protein
MSRRRLVFAAVALGVGVIAYAVFAARGPARVPVDLGVVTKQATFRSTVTASGEIVASRYADIGATVMGRIVALPVAEGDVVKAGQMLARIDPVQAESEALSAAEQTRALQAEEKAAEEQVRAVLAEADAADARARDAQQVLARRRELSRDQLVPASDLESAKAAAESAAAQVQSARAAVDRARRALDAAGRRVAQARAQQTRAADVVSKTAIVAPIDGTVTRLQVRNGEMVVVGIQNQPGTTLMTISDLSTIDAEVKVAEADVLTVRTGQSAAVTLDALAGRRFPGRVVEIGASALPVTGTGAAAREFRVVVRLDQPGDGLRPGLTCDTEIVTSERTNVLTVPLQSVVLRTVDGESRSGVFVVEDRIARFRPVTTGVIGGLSIEVEGIPDGTAVVTGPYQVLRELNDGALVSDAGER